MSFLDQVYAASEQRSSKADVVEYYQEKYRGKGQEGWRQRLISDLYDVRYGELDYDEKERTRLKKNLARNFDPSRLNKPGNKRIQEEMREIGESLPMKAPENGYHVWGTLRFKISEECVEREVDDIITGSDAEALVQMSNDDMIQAVINLYMEGDPNEPSVGIESNACGVSELNVEPFDAEPVEV